MSSSLRMSGSRGTKQLENIYVEWMNRDGLTQSQIARIDDQVFGAIAYYLKLLKNSNYRALLKYLREGKLLKANLRKPITMNLVYVATARDSGMGSGDDNGFKLFAGDMSLHDPSELANPPATAIHELHHVFGSNTEFDKGSEAAYMGFVLGTQFDNPVYAKMKDRIVLEGLVLISNKGSREAWYKQQRQIHKFLYNQGVSKYISIFRNAGMSSADLRALLEILKSR